MKTIKGILIILFFLFSFNCFSQDYIIKKNNKKINCSIKKIDQVKIYCTTADEKLFFFLTDISEYSINGIVVNLTSNFSKYKSDFIVKLDNDTVFCEIEKINNSRISYNTFPLKPDKLINTKPLKEIKSFYFNPINLNTSDIPNKSDTLNNSSKFNNSQNNNSKILCSAGAELKTASNNYYTGFWISLGGGIILAIGANILSPEIIIVGCVVSLAGAILSLESISHIGKAGKILMSIYKP